MKKFFFTALAGALLSVAVVGTAGAETLSDKIMRDHPGVVGGTTANPTARPDDAGSGLQRKAMQDHPGTAGGNTASPVAKVDGGSIRAVIAGDRATN